MKNYFKCEFHQGIFTLTFIINIFQASVFLCFKKSPSLSACLPACQLASHAIRQAGSKWPRPSTFFLCIKNRTENSPLEKI